MLILKDFENSFTCLKSQNVLGLWPDEFWCKINSQIFIKWHNIYNFSHIEPLFGLFKYSTISKHYNFSSLKGLDKQNLSIQLIWCCSLMIVSLKLATSSANISAKMSSICWDTKIPRLHSLFIYEIKSFINKENIIGELTHPCLVRYSI